MYRVQEDGAEFLFAYLKPNSLVVSSALKSQKHHSTPSDKEEKIDAMGRKFYLTGALGIKAMSYMACMNWYSYAHWEQLLAVMDTLPDDK